MSRYAINEPDPDRYEPKPLEDVDVPDFDQPDPPVDPAEHAAHALLEALGTLEQELAQTTDLARAHALKQFTKRAFDAVNRLDLKASAKIDDVMERRR